MPERRKIKREILFFYARVFDHETNKPLGHLGDLNTGGAMIISDQPLKVDEEMVLGIELPIGRYTKEELVVNALSVWSRPDLDPQLYNTGFKLVDVSDEDKGIIEAILEEYALRGRSTDTPK